MNAKHRTSIIARITLFTGVVAALLSTLLAVVLMVAIHNYATDAVYTELRGASGRVAQKVEQYKTVALAPAQHDPQNVQIIDQSGLVVASTAALRGKPPMADFALGAMGSKKAVVCDGVFGAGRCHIVMAQTAHRPGGDWTVYASMPVVPMYVKPWLAVLVIGSTTLLAVAITCLGYRIATASLRPVSAIRRELDEINATCPGRRVPVPPSKDEIHDLAESVNHTLTRLQGAMEQQRQFASDASHDLRSPIAAMRVEVEDALMSSPEPTMTRVGNTVLCSLDRLEAIVSDLLFIARLDAGTPCGNDPIDLAELASQECRARRQTTKRFVCSLQRGVLILGDRVRLSRLLTNLLDNADRHAETTIMIKVSRADAKHNADSVAVLEVIDDGPGIDPDKRDLVFQRFARLDSARAKDAGGTGLGLSIARQIAESCGGTLRIEDSDRGARFVLRLPCYENAHLAHTAPDL
ncbi:two-component sensor histidine kinase [Acrocarpospora phusangensis]|uniref:histidine kinase n=1 Tax=Acrocarpospora phusangensis TaxID=1070424 RepID=A0A919Q9P8_9ACTN|nr:HAMP domain-containing sensor histidine kinase [Acrocarpospora phusangensis]GIH24922.1 two-component sensor histidine kinase [Acrocarpospora phusangensis]